MTSAPGVFRDPGSLQREIPPATIEFVEVIIAGDVGVELRVDSGWSRITSVVTSTAPAAGSLPLWEAGDRA